MQNTSKDDCILHVCIRTSTFGRNFEPLGVWEYWGWGYRMHWIEYSLLFDVNCSEASYTMLSFVIAYDGPMYCIEGLSSNLLGALYHHVLCTKRIHTQFSLILPYSCQVYPVIGCICRWLQMMFFMKMVIKAHCKGPVVCQDTFRWVWGALDHFTNYCH